MHVIFQQDSLKLRKRFVDRVRKNLIRNKREGIPPLFRIYQLEGAEFLDLQIPVSHQSLFQKCRQRIDESLRIRLLHLFPLYQQPYKPT